MAGLIPLVLWIHSKKNLSNQRPQINSMLKQAGFVSVVTDKSPDAQDR